jgi:hypothetical protein
MFEQNLRNIVFEEVSWIDVFSVVTFLELRLAASIKPNRIVIFTWGLELYWIDVARYITTWRALTRALSHVIVLDTMSQNSSSSSSSSSSLARQPYVGPGLPQKLLPAKVSRYWFCRFRDKSLFQGEVVSPTPIPRLSWRADVFCQVCLP